MKKTISTAILSLLALASSSAFAATEVKLQSSDPANGSSIANFSGMTLYFENVTDISEIEAADITYTYFATSDVTPAVGLSMEAELLPDRHGIYVGFSDAQVNEMRDTGVWPINAPGRYVVSLDKGDIKMKTASGDYENAATDIEYFVIPAATPILSPLPTDQLYSLSVFTLNYSHFASVTMNDGFKATLTGPDGELPLSAQAAEENMAVLLSLDEPATTPGEYTLTIPAGALTLAGNPEAPDQLNPELSVKYTVLETPTFGYKSIYPEPGVVEQFGTVSVIYFTPPSINKECKETVKLYINGEVAQELGNTSSRIQFPTALDDPNSIIFAFVTSLKDMYTAPGEYKVVVPEGFFLFQGYGESPEQVFEYTILKSVSYSYEPLAGTVPSLNHFTVTFPGASDIVENKLVADDEGNGVIKVYVWEESAEDIIPTVTIEGNQVKLIFEELTYKCQYAVSIPHGALTMTVDGERMDNPSIEAIYYVPKIPQPTITPAEGAVTPDQLTELTLTLDKGYTYATWFDSFKARLVRVAEDGSESEPITYFAKKAGDLSHKGTDTIKLYEEQPYPELADGNYAVIINRGSFSVNPPEGEEGGFTTCAYTWHYTIGDPQGGVESVIGQEKPDTVTVFGIDGVCLLRNAAPEAINQLKKGLYIINGKKVLVK